MKVNILKHVEFEGPGYFLDIFEDMDFDIKVHELYNGDKPWEYDSDLILIMGGPMNIQDEQNYPFLKKEKEYIAKSIQSGKKIIGICLGAQLIADVLGAKVNRGEYKEIGWFTLKKKANEIMRFLPEYATVFHWHSDSFELPNEASNIFSTDVTQNQAFIYKDNVLALQFHLEMDEPIIRNLLRNCKNELDDSKYVMSENEILKGLEKYSYSNKKMLKNMMRNFIS